MNQTRIKPQDGFQTLATDCPADIAIIGGSAGCGKTFCLLYEPVKYSFLGIEGFNGIIFRRNLTEINATGGLWSKAHELYNNLSKSDRPNFYGGNTHFRIKFPGGFDLQLAHLHDPRTVYSYQGTEICYIAFDELTHFTEEQFFYMLSRNRSTCGVEPYVRASTNPQGEGWVKRLVSWWLYPDDYKIELLRGAPIPERQGQMLYLGRVDEKIVMRESPEEVHHIIKTQLGIDLPMKSIRSITFVAGKIFDNEILMTANPGYLGNLMGLSETERAQLLDGRWILFDNDQFRLYANNAISDLFSNFVPRGKDRYITADVAFEGADKFVIAIWEGWVLVELRVFDKSLGDEVLNEIKKAAQEWRVPFRNIAFDATGVGAAYKGFLRTSIAVVSNSAPMAKKGEGKNTKTDAQQYFNLRSQLYFLLRDVIENSEMLILDERYRAIIEEELKAIKKMQTNSDAKLRIISKDQIKEKIGRSPDYADVISMRCVFDLIPILTTKQRTLQTFSN